MCRVNWLGAWLGVFVQTLGSHTRELCKKVTKNFSILVLWRSQTKLLLLLLLMCVFHAKVVNTVFVTTPYWIYNRHMGMFGLTPTGLNWDLDSEITNKYILLHI